MSEFIYEHTLLQREGWSKKKIKELIKPDKIVKNPRFRSASEAKLYSLQKIEEIESTPDFVKASIKSELLNEKSNKTKIENLIKIAKDYPIILPHLNQNELDNRSDEYYIDYLDKKSDYNNKVQSADINYRSLSKEEVLLGRIRLIVDYLEFVLFEKNVLFEKTKGRTGRDEADKILCKRFIFAVKEKYPSLIKGLESDLKLLDNIQISIEQYEEIISKFSKRRKEILIVLYQNGPFKDTIQIANSLGYPNINSANLQIGNMGLEVTRATGIVPTDTYEYQGKELPAYYTLIHDHFDNGWELQKNLKTAIENLGWIKSNAQKAYIFIWNPQTWPWSDIEDCIEQCENYGTVEITWKCGNTKSISIGDRIFLIKLGTKPKGIIASGYAKTSPYIDKNDGSLYIKIELEVLFDPEIDEMLPIEELQTGNLASQGSWTPQASGIAIKSEIIEDLELKWADFLRKQGIVYTSTSTIVQDTYIEGTVTQVLLTRYERDSKARSECLKHYGYSCSVCDFNFEKYYGDIGKEFIHVHHLQPISTYKKEYKINPIEELRPVCPNCHAMLHRQDQLFTIEELKELIKKRQ